MKTTKTVKEKTYTLEEFMIITAQDIEEQVKILRKNLRRKRAPTPFEYV